MKLTPEQLNEILQRPAIRKANSAGCEAQASIPQRPVRHEPLATAAREAANSSRFRVIVTGRRRRLIDPDNLCAKYFIDCLRYAGLIPDDRAQDIELSVRQEKIGKDEEEVTIVQVEELP